MYKNSLVTSYQRNTNTCKDNQGVKFKRPGRKRKEVKIIQLVGKIVDIMMEKTTIQKYLDPGSPIIKTYINGVEIPNALIDLGEAINIMSKQTMNQLKLSNL